METTYGKTPLTIHAARRPHSQRMGESHPCGTEKQPGTRFNITGRNILGHKGSIRRNAILAGTVTYCALRLPPFRYNCPTQWYCTARGYSFNAGFITLNNHEAHSARRQRPSSGRGLPPFSSHLYQISPKGSYQLVHHANQLGRITCI